MLPTTTTLSAEDRTKLSTLFRTRGDAVSFAHLREEDPLETLLWLDQPHIKPWHDAIKNAHRDHEATETHLSLARALKDITRILDLEADSTLRIRAVNAIIKLANAIHRGTRPAPVTPRQRRRAEIGAEDAQIILDLHADRRARHTQDLKDANAPLGATPSWAREIPTPLVADDSSDLRERNGSARSAPISPICPIGPISPTAPPAHARTPAHLNGTHRNAKHTTQAGTPRPPPDNRPNRRHRR